MFPYTVPNLIVAWTFLIFLLQDFFLFQTIFDMAILWDLIILALFIFIAKKYYKKTPQSIVASAFIIAYNLAVVPLLIVNLLTIPYLFTSMGASGMIFLFPMIYSPNIFIVSFVIVYVIKKIMNKKSQ